MLYTLELMLLMCNHDVAMETQLQDSLQVCHWSSLDWVEEQFACFDMSVYFTFLIQNDDRGTYSMIILCNIG